MNAQTHDNYALSIGIKKVKSKKSEQGARGLGTRVFLPCFRYNARAKTLQIMTV